VSFFVSTFRAGPNFFPRRALWRSQGYSAFGRKCGFNLPSLYFFPIKGVRLLPCHSRDEVCLPLCFRYHFAASSFFPSPRDIASSPGRECQGTVFRGDCPHYWPRTFRTSLSSISRRLPVVAGSVRYGEIPPFLPGSFSRRRSNRSQARWVYLS